ncbi:MAG: tRNA (adenosine(37)-N6)-dimethylallyltransferase MiaA [candidate division KSB1 bacterium]|nr:tRNA (adenosine(37)-N6)-dimethylallyltransferase MiaA [candidate division KSB1 bacterium]
MSCQTGGVRDWNELRRRLLERELVPVLVGPTAVGKTALSLLLAEAMEAEIVSADSRQVYRYMDIGTAKPRPEDRRRVPHHFIDVRDPDEYYSAGQFGREAREKIQQLLGQGRLPLVVGGSGFYLRALFDGLFEPRISDPEVKERIRDRIRREGLPAVYAYLCRVDPEAAGRIHPNDEQRIVRALEVYEIAGEPMSHFFAQKPAPAPFGAIWIGLERPREELYHRIDRRVEEMFAAGLVEEVRQLLERGYTADLNALRTVGYREVIGYLQGEFTLDRAVYLVKRNSRRYAKRQLTWFRRDQRIHWVPAEEETIERIVSLLRNAVANPLHGPKEGSVR